MFKVQISIVDAKQRPNFVWGVTSEELPTREKLCAAIIAQIETAQIAGAHAANGTKIGKIRPTNSVEFKVQKFDEIWEDVNIQEQFAQLGRMRLMSRTKSGWEFNDFTESIDFVLRTMQM